MTAVNAGVCQNLGQCVEGLNTYNCNCTERKNIYLFVNVRIFATKLDNNKYDCATHQNGGQCVDGLSTFNCNCTERKYNCNCTGQ